MIFEYSALDYNTKKITNTINAETIKDARRLIKEQQLKILSIKPVKKKNTTSFLSTKLDTGDLVTFTRQLSSLIGASIPIDESIKTIMHDATNKKLNKVISIIYSGVLEGMPLYQAMENTKNFDEYFIATIKSGELGSNLSTVLERLSVEVAKQHEFRKKISAATTYPLIVTIVAFLVIFGLLLFVVPQITQVFADNNQVLPPITIFVIALSDFVRENITAILIVLTAVVVIIKIIFRYEVVKLLWHQMLVKIPLLGRIISIANATRFARTLSLLHASNTPIVDALNYSSNVVKFIPMKQAIKRAMIKVKEGATIYGALKSEQAISGMMLYMISSGEKSSQLSQMLDKAADSSEYELENSTKKILNSFEPLIILIMGTIVFVIVISVLLPIFEINNAVS